MQNLIRQIANKRGILILTDSDSAGFVIRNFLKGSVPVDKVKHGYIPQLSGKEKRKAEMSKEGFLGVEGVSEKIIIDAIRKSGATILNEESKGKTGGITKTDFYELGLSGKENSAILRSKILKKMNMPSYLTANGMIAALNCLYSFEELKEIVNTIDK